MVDATPVQSVGSEPAGPSFVFVTANDVGFVSNFGFRVSGLPVSVHSSHSQASGNPVKIGDGCATVTGYRLPRPLVPKETGKAGARSYARSQDIGLGVLVVVPLSGINFSVKRRMRPALGVCAQRDSMDAFILRFVGV
jgi:hypothetical protein